MLTRTPALIIIALVCNIVICYGQVDSARKHYHHVLVLPVIARSIETSWSFGAAGSYTFRIKRDDSTSRTSNLQGLGLYSLKKQVIFALNGTIYFPREQYILSHQLSYSFFPDKFWGLGKRAPASNEEPYDFRQFYLYLHGQHSVGKHLYLGALYEYQQLLKINYIAGGLFDQQNVLGRARYHVSGFGLSFAYDTRNNAFSPDQGNLFQVSFNHFDNFFGSDFQYTNYVIDLRKYMAIHKKQVLAIQAFGFFNGGQVPLRSLASFGGANSMRGYYNGRYRDKNQAVIQTEYRVPLFWRLGMVGFVGLGEVSNSLKDFGWDCIRYSYGGGLRVALNKTERLNLRLDYGIGKGNNHGFYFQLGEAF